MKPAERAAHRHHSGVETGALWSMCILLSEAYVRNRAISGKVVFIIES
jgi:hypothetical protein